MLPHRALPWPRLALAVLLAAGPAAAQLADLQPGRNFVASPNFGLGRSADADAGDIDGDGDLDVAVGNGKDFGPEPNRIFVNRGGLQGGVAGTFVEETAARLPGGASGETRDIEFVDLDDDGDLDLCEVNDGTSSVGGISRFHENQGGLQAGLAGYYVESSDRTWGTLLSVPASQQLAGPFGPHEAWYADADFADLDDDGDTDLFMASTGAAIAGTEESRLFLNDGLGVLHELWPWADPAADVKLHSFDADLCDLDGDFDIDVAVSSRNSQSRLYLNNLNGPLSSAPFQDVTGPALLAKGAAQTDNLCYEVEFADLDGDGDFDLWMQNYLGFKDTILQNRGNAHSGQPEFTLATGWIKDDPNQDEQEADVLDYDGDGDLDIALANFSGTNRLYQSGLAQGLDPATQGLYHRTGAATGLAPAPELPTGNPGGLTTNDIEAADLDNDGDDDLFVVNEGNQQNYLYTNALGVPDTHAPTFHAVTDQPDLDTAAPVVIHAAVRDNHAWYVVARHDTRLVWSVDGGPETSQPMFSQGGQQFRGVIPAVSGTVSYRVECSDRAGNTGVSDTQVFVAGPGSPWSDLGFALPGTAGAPELAGTGTLAAGSPGALTLSDAAPLAPALLSLSLGSAPVPFKGGTLAAFPPLLQLPLGTDAGGGLSLPWAAWPAGLAPGTALVFQCAVQDAGAVHGVALSNALQGTTP